jgi:hypothetical protein
MSTTVSNLTVHLEKILKFDFRPYSAFKFGGRNRRPKAENFRFGPKISASGIPLISFPSVLQSLGRLICLFVCFLYESTQFGHWLPQCLLFIVSQRHA